MQGRRALGLASAEQGSKPGQQNDKTEWFREVVVCSGVEALGDVLVERATAETALPAARISVACRNGLGEATSAAAYAGVGCPSSPGVA